MPRTIKHVIKAHTKPFDWQTNNCFHAAAEMIDYCHDVDCIKEFGFELASTERANMMRLAKKGYKSIEALMDAHFTRKDPMFASSGDLCLINDSVGIYYYDTAVGFYKGELIQTPRAKLNIVYDIWSFKWATSSKA